MISGFTNWALLAVALVGNCGFFLTCFNQVNATGLKRRITKRVEKLFLVACFVVPALVAWVDWPHVWDWAFPNVIAANTTVLSWPKGFLFPFWLVTCVLWSVVVGPIWLESRRWIWPPANLKACKTQQYCVAKEIGTASGNTPLTKFLELLPWNQINCLEVSQKHIRLPRSIPAADGLKIGHLSDLHFTGQLTRQHYRFVFDQFQALQPDLIVISGDIIDYAKCLPWIADLLGPLKAPLGKVFVLGNHDNRLPDLSEATRTLANLGFHDAGVADVILQANSELTIQIKGNERRWLHRHHANTAHQATPEKLESQSNMLRLAVSHSPDQLRWAQSNEADLMLAGHTHGGQVRLPLIGPLVAPSHFGSRFASGVFLRKNTLMHVSRGVAGTHPLRLRCMPEVTLLTIDA